jgi:hypothetical protein
MNEYVYLVYWLHIKDHIDPYKDGYIGITKNFNRRLKQHLSGSTNPHLSNAINKYGKENILCKFIAKGLSLHEAKLLELKLRNQDEIGWNITKGGSKPPICKSLSDTAKRKISKALKGKKQSIEHTELLSKIRTKNMLLVTNLKTNIQITYASIKEFLINNTSFSRSCIYACCSNQYKSHNGYKFEYIPITEEK